MIASTYCLTEFPQCRERKPKQSPEKFHSWGDGVGSPRESRLLEWQKRVPRKKTASYRENSVDLKKVSSSIEQRIDQHMYEETTQGQGKNYKK